MDLKELRDTLLRVDHPEKILSLADTYMKHMQEAGTEFRLPKEHIVVKVLLEYYAEDLGGWVKFVRGVRDRLPMVGRSYHPGVNKVYRTLETRYVQVVRRKRIDAAVAQAVKKRLIEDDYASKVAYSNKCVQAWKLRRDNMLKMAANQTKSGRLSVEEREGMLEEFWLHVDEETRNGELPKP